MRILIVTDAWHPQVNGVVRTLDCLIHELEAAGHEIETVTPDSFFGFPMPTYPEIRLSLTTGRTMRRRMREAAPDAIHIATEGPLGLAARMACLKLGWPYTTSYHTRFPEYLNARLPVPVGWTHAWLRRFHNSGEACLVATQSIAAELRARGFRNLTHWTRGVDRDLFHPARRNPDGELAGVPEPIFINVGRLAVEKNLEAFLSLDLPGTKVVVGDGPDRESLARRYPQAVFPGLREGRALAELYASADVFVFPSLTDTFGNVIIEALASGLPVAAFPVPGPADIITNPEVGVLDDDLRRACLAALALDGSAARRFSARYTWAECAAAFVDTLVPVSGTNAERGAEQGVDPRLRQAG